MLLLLAAPHLSRTLRRAATGLISVVLVTFALNWLDIPQVGKNKKLRTTRSISDINNDNDYSVVDERQQTTSRISTTTAIPTSSIIVNFFQELENSTGGILDNGQILNHMAARYLVQESNLTTPLQSFRPPVIHMDCSHAAYSHVLTGESNNDNGRTRYIIDVVAFGFDVDYLEIRLLEFYDLVDQFVIVEQNTTHRGEAKPFLLPELLQSDRFKRFQSKIDYLQDHVPPDAVQLLQTDKYALENRVRSLPIQHLQRTFHISTASSHHNMEILVLQNDGDEIITRKVMAHLKHCEYRPNVTFPIYTPALAFKRNVAWLQSRPDMMSLPLATDTTYNSNDSSSTTLRPDTSILRGVTWRHPFVWSYEDVLKANSTHRRGVVVDNNRSFHMGIAAAMHFSDPAHPILAMIKFFSTAEAVPHRFSPDFWVRVREKRITESDIRKELFRCKASGEHKWHHMSEFDRGVQDFVVEQLPWSVRDNPDRYPWLYSPGLPEREKTLFDRQCDSRVMEAKETGGDEAALP